MEQPVITFEEIIKLNGHEWDRAYAVLNYHPDKGNIKKAVMDYSLVIYHNLSQVNRHNLIHDKIFLDTANAKVLMGSRRTRINRFEGNS
ncbi:hypothetical protein [uncultured Algoriphagus sp.]|uniref:hypothetical protein n=1 Tax=uncultured Algoriphagus sp. TaxID=417365 RepID=UPI0030EE0495|tara:strand:- start:2196 stop:2462 length:267 start_codon:yes stop_codon:yes gene_type:complete